MLTQIKRALLYFQNVFNQNMYLNALYFATKSILFWVLALKSKEN